MREPLGATWTTWVAASTTAPKHKIKEPTTSFIVLVGHNEWIRAAFYRTAASQPKKKTLYETSGWSSTLSNHEDTEKNSCGHKTRQRLLLRQGYSILGYIKRRNVNFFFLNSKINSEIINPPCRIWVSYRSIEGVAVHRPSKKDRQLISPRKFLPRLMS